MKTIRFLLPLLVLLWCFGSTQAFAEDLSLWGKQTEGFGMTNAKTEGNKIEVSGSAEIVKVEGDAKSYCIWKRGVYKGFLCGGSARKTNLVGKILPEGTYTVLPGLSKGQNSAQVTIHLKEK